MSGIYIPGMEIPKNCCECPVNLELCKRGYKYLAKHLELYDQRADDCPLIPVPDHGRLIDADALEADNWHLQRYVTTPTGCWLESEMLKDVPTIIPAVEPVSNSYKLADKDGAE